MDIQFTSFLHRMEASSEYISMANLKHGCSYQIFARNAYAGVWIENKSCFMIARYKIGPKPFLFDEYHFDVGSPLGTVKPIQLIEECPIQIKDNYEDNEAEALLTYLERLEVCNPVVNGYDSVQSRKMAAIAFENRLVKRLKNQTVNIPLFK